MVEGNTLLDFVNQIREEIKKDKNSSIAVRIDVTDDDLRKHSAKLALKKIPAVVALSYAAEIGPYDFVFENGVWVLRNTPEDQRWYPDDVTTFSCQLATKEEMAALGFVESKDGVISVESGPKWPEEEWGAMERIGDGILLRAFYHEIESFRFLLQLHRRGYQVPKINSDDKGRGQLESAPKREGDGEEKAIRK